MARNSGNTAARNFAPGMYGCHAARPRSCESPVWLPTGNFRVNQHSPRSLVSAYRGFWRDGSVVIGSQITFVDARFNINFGGLTFNRYSPRLTVAPRVKFNLASHSIRSSPTLAVPSTLQPRDAEAIAGWIQVSSQGIDLRTSAWVPRDRNYLRLTRGLTCVQLHLGHITTRHGPTHLGMGSQGPQISLFDSRSVESTDLRLNKFKFNIPHLGPEVLDNCFDATLNEDREYHCCSNPPPTYLDLNERSPLQHPSANFPSSIPSREFRTWVQFDRSTSSVAASFVSGDSMIHLPSQHRLPSNPTQREFPTRVVYPAWTSYSFNLRIQPTSRGFPSLVIARSSNSTGVRPYRTLVRPYRTLSVLRLAGMNSYRKQRAQVQQTYAPAIHPRRLHVIVAVATQANPSARRFEGLTPHLQGFTTRSSVLTICELHIVPTATEWGGMRRQQGGNEGTARHVGCKQDNVAAGVLGIVSTGDGLREQGGVGLDC
ncbi:hypothetical protein C8R46DRAFT_1035359 [Mycena filopes]|nr:hypothetical protein C8R46DRAFT_1035359 [Mycena filopes]